MTPLHWSTKFLGNVAENFVFEWVDFFAMILNHSEKFLTRFRYVSWIYMLRGGFVDTDPKCFRLALRGRPFWWCPDPSTVPPRLLNPLGWVWSHVRVVLKRFAWPPNGSSRRPVAYILSGNKVMRTQEPDGKRRRGRPRARPRKCEFTSPRFSARSWALNISECSVSVSATGLRHGVKTVPPPVHDKVRFHPITQPSYDLLMLNGEGNPLPSPQLTGFLANNPNMKLVRIFAF